MNLDRQPLDHSVGQRSVNLTRKQRLLLDYLIAYIDENGTAPSFEEMAGALDLASKSGVHRLIEALEERGWIRRLPNRARAIDVLRRPEEKGAKSFVDYVLRVTAANASVQDLIKQHPFVKAHGG